MKNHQRIQVLLFIFFLCHLGIVAQVPLQRPVKKQVIVKPEQRSDQKNKATNKNKVTARLEGNENGYSWVDLGLSVKWAETNLGISSPELPGDYYSWGDINIKSSYETFNCVTLAKNAADVRNWNGHDIVKTKRGGTWRLPTRSEMSELRDKCRWVWSSYGSVRGYRVYGPNGKSIYLPASGFKRGPDRFESGNVGYYWSSEPTGLYSAFQLCFSKDRIDVAGGDRDLGRTIRPVCK